MPTNIAINGFGRIGRATLKLALEDKRVNVVAINDLIETELLAHLLKYDSVYGTYNKKIDYTPKSLIINNTKIPVFSEPNPEKLPWKKLKVDVAIESTGIFKTKEEAKKHVQAGAKMVLISAPSKEGGVNTYVKGVNDDDFDPNKDKVIDNASCTTNCIAPVMEILERNFSVEKSFMTTIHSYTSTQNLIDGPNKDPRRARAAAINIIPTTTGATKATAKVIPALANNFSGLSIRVPTPVGSLSDITALLKKDTTIDELNTLFVKESKEARYKGVLEASEEPLVSSDIIGNTHSSIIDLNLTNVVSGNLVKIIAWYDNELAYSKRLVEQAVEYSRLIK